MRLRLAVDLGDSRAGALGGLLALGERVCAGEMAGFCSSLQLGCDAIIGSLMWVNNNTMGNCLKLVLNWLQSFSAATLIISGKKLREVKHIAQGGYGFVTLVQDTETRRLYAMKKMICQTPEQRIMYQQEVKAMKELSNCEHVIEFYGTHEIQRNGYLQAYILMEYADKTVYDLLAEGQKKGAKLPEKQILRILRDTALGLKEMHGVGIMHHDVKVQNILISKDGVAKLCDFGSCSRQKIDLASLHKSQVYRHEQRFQKNTTLMYRPPQMIDVYLKYPVDERVDIWMLGCVLYVMNYEIHPFQEEGKLSIVNASIRYPKTVSAKMQKLMRHMLTPNPYFRPTLDQIISIIEQWDHSDFELNQVAKKIEQNEKYLAMDQFSKIQKPEWHKLRPEGEWSEYSS